MQLTPKLCCGQKRESAFCPDCGKALNNHPLCELLAYCRAMQTRTADKVHAKAKAGQRTQANTVSRWARWIAALEKVTGQKPAEAAETLKLVTTGE